MSIKEIVVFVVLEISQQFMCWPAWSSDVDFAIWNLSSGTIESHLLEFTWPDSTVSGNARFWAAVMDPMSSVLQLNYDYCDFACE